MSTALSPQKTASGLPTIASYPVPTSEGLPANKVSWPLDPDRSVLLIHDMQNHFLGAFPRDEEPLPVVVRNIARLREAAAAAGVPVVFSRQPGDQDPAERALLTDFWGPGLSARGSASDIVDELAPTSTDVVLTKWRYSAFRRTPLRTMLRDWGRDQLVITGVYAHIGCLLTAADAFMDDVQPFVVGDAVADFSAADHADALSYAARRCARVIDVEQAVTAFTLDVLRSRVAALVGEPADTISEDDNLVDLGLDSIRIMELVEQSRAAGHELAFSELAEVPTLRAWRALLRS